MTEHEMSADLVIAVAAMLGVRVAHGRRPAGRSAAHVVPVTQQNGAPAVLKVTGSGAGHHALDAARRKLDFYLLAAEQAPIRTPTLLGHLDAGVGLAILLSAHGRTEPARTWTRASWVTLYADLARLHRLRPPRASSWRRHRSLPEAMDQPNLPLIEDFWRPSLGAWLDGLVQDRPLLQRSILAAGEAFIHGDCHTDNILLENGELVWVDWQAAGLGSPAVDLALPSVRATPSGTTLPAGAFAEYCRVGRRDPGTTRQFALAAELSIFIYEWPHYAPYNTPLGIARVRERTRHLAQRWRGSRPRG